ncbi:MAG: Peptidase M16C associated [Lentisphaerae bacterium ADurb.BinA184]|nr:MAG: Peptidase M16C associated [Lentisphaerae bacterium ADurb.BinA184]
MARPSTLPFQVGDRYAGFTVRRITPLPSLRLTAFELEHDRTGARLLHLHAADAENLFSISFPTPPPDDTGLPHILEHAVLSGSRRFPVRDPFFEMLKMSMATFLNALTGWDCTYYPVCSNVRKDLFNLAEVYFDAVFHPLLEEKTFKREGHHLQPADPEAPTGALTVNGIVYNEMKAAFSRPEGRLFRLACRGLFPDTCYGRESGGDPVSIPDLTYADFRRFHATWYHPSNAHFVLYGDIPTADHLDFLAERLAPFDRQDIRPDFGRQPRWTAPRQLAERYALGPDEEAREKTFFQINWLVGNATDATDAAMFNLLTILLLGDDAAPLKKAIIDSKLGQDLIHSGFMGTGLETVFVVGLKGSEPERADAFRDLVLGTLERLAAEGFEEALVTSAFRRYTYECLEVKPEQPLEIMESVLESWIYGADPLLFLHQDEILTDCRALYAGRPEVFRRMIRDRLLDNPHRFDVVLSPDREWQARADAAFEARMCEVRKQFTDNEMRDLAAEAETLEEDAGTPNSPAAVASLPQLQLGDLPDRPVHIPTTTERLPGGRELLVNDVFANGVNYLQVAVDLHGLPGELWPHLPRYLETINRLGAAGMDYGQIARRKSACTGGFACGSSFSVHATDPATPCRYLWFSLKTLDDQIEEALALLEDLFFRPDPRDRARFADVITQGMAALRTGLVNAGPSTALRYISRGLTPEGHLSEITRGVTQLDRITALHRAYDEQADGVAGHAEAIAAFLRQHARLTASFTGSERPAAVVRETLSRWLEGLPPGEIADSATGFEPFAGVPRYGLAAPMNVAHCAQLIPAVHCSHPDATLLTLAMSMLKVDYMVSELRFKGNAYGASCSYDGATISLSTYADPHITRTFDVFAKLPDYIREVDWQDVDVARGIIATAKYALEPIRPEEATGWALSRRLTGETREVREARYAQLLAATPAEVKRAVLAVLEAGMPRAPLGVLSSREKIEAANREMPGREFEVRDVLS